MDREKLVKVVIESEEDLDLEDIRMLQEKDIPDSLFLTELNTIAGDLDWSIGSEASKCFEENEVIRSPDSPLYVGYHRDVYRDLVRFINYRGEFKDSVLKTRDRAIEFRASDVIIPKDFNDYKTAIKTLGSRFKVYNYGVTSEWRIDSNSDVKITNENKKGWCSFDNIVIRVVGDNSEFVFSSEVPLELVNIDVTLVLFGENNKVIIDMNNFGIKSGVNLKRMPIAKNNEVIVRHMIPDFVQVEENFTDNNNNLRMETLYDD